MESLKQDILPIKQHATKNPIFKKIASVTGGIIISIEAIMNQGCGQQNPCWLLDNGNQPVLVFRNGGSPETQETAGAEWNKFAEQYDGIFTLAKSPDDTQDCALPHDTNETPQVLFVACGHAQSSSGLKSAEELTEGTQKAEQDWLALSEKLSLSCEDIISKTK